MVQEGDLVERMNRGPVGWAPAPEITNLSTEDRLEAIPEDLSVKKSGGDSWLVQAIFDHRRTSGGAIKFKVEWQGKYFRDSSFRFLI